MLGGDKSFASLTLGGYDASKLVPNDVSFSLAGIATHDIVVGIQSVTFSNSKTTEMPLMAYGSGILAFIDSTLPNLWLPTPVCDAFAEAFGLTFVGLKLYYTINDTMHDANIQQNASVTFQLGNFVTGGNTVNITIPYSSFDLNSTALISGNSTRYFPLRQANTPDQYTLGRVFLQEAFLSVDYERGVFNVSQADFSGRPSHVVAIPPLNATETGSGGSSTTSATPGSTTDVSIVSQSSGLGTGAIAGIAIGIVLLAILLASAVIFVVWRKRRERKQRSRNAFELPAEDQKFPTRPFGYFNPFSKNHRDSMHIAATNEYTVEHVVEHAGKEIYSPDTSHAAANPSTPTELEGPEVIRAELHSPEPPDLGAVSPQSEKPGMELPMESNHETSHRAPPSPNIDSATPSAFRSPRIGFTRYEDVTTPPPPLSPEESERGDYFPHR
ncbi:hypothetical protein MMC30_008190 [Trapelia coarctata]|nr:hypothetical protein [Trapelia coarctata]